MASQPKLILLLSICSIFIVLATFVGFHNTSLGSIYGEDKGIEVRVISSRSSGGLLQGSGKSAEEHEESEKLAKSQIDALAKVAQRFAVETASKDTSSSAGGQTDNQEVVASIAASLSNAQASPAVNSSSAGPSSTAAREGALPKSEEGVGQKADEGEASDGLKKGDAGAAKTEGKQQEEAIDQPKSREDKGSIAPAEATTPTEAAASSASSGNLTAVTPSCGLLTRELVASFARNNTVMLTVCDWAIFGTLGLNWMHHLEQLGLKYWLVGATDLATAQFMGRTAAHACFRMGPAAAEEGGESQHVYRYGSEQYISATWQKVQVVKQMVDWGFNVIHSDVDVIWFRDPLPYFLGPQAADGTEAADIIISTDLVSTSNGKGDDGLEVALFQDANFNTGIYFVRATPGGRQFMSNWANERPEITKKFVNDQIGLYRLVRKRKGVMHERVLRLEPVASEVQPMNVGALAVHVALNGYSYFLPQLHREREVAPLCIHLTWVPLSREGKLHRMRDGMLYRDPDEYYLGRTDSAVQTNNTSPAASAAPLPLGAGAVTESGPIRLLAADIESLPTPPGFNEWKETEDMIIFHLKNLEFQLRQVYRAFAVAASLRRTLLLPLARCHCFKNWFMTEQCRIPGDRVTSFPISCMLDQVFRPKVLYNWPPLSTSEGPFQFTFREFSILDNPDTPEEFRSFSSDTVLVAPEGYDVEKANAAAEAAAAVAVATAAATPPQNTTDLPDGPPELVLSPRGASPAKATVHLAPNMTQNAIVAALEPYKDARVIRLRRPVDLFGGWDDQVLRESFEAFVQGITANWCCRDVPYIKKGLPEKVKMAMLW